MNNENNYFIIPYKNYNKFNGMVILKLARLATILKTNVHLEKIIKAQIQKWKKNLDEMN